MRMNEPGEGPPRRRGSLWSLVPSLLLSGVGLWLAVRGVAWQALAETLGQVAWLPLGLGVLSLAASWYGTIVRQDLLLYPHAANRWRLARIFLMSHTTNTVLPWKLGTFLRGYLVAQASNTSVGFAMASVLVERILDTAIVALLFVLLIGLIPLPAWLREGGIAVGVLMVPALLGLALVPLVVRALRGGRWSARYQGWLAGSPVGRLLNQSLTGLSVLQHRALWLPLLWWTLFVAATGILTNFLVMASLGIQVHWLGAVAVLVALLLGSKVPASPGQIGVFHAIARATLELFGVGATEALAYGVLLHLVVFVAPALLGALVFLGEGPAGGLRASLRGALARDGLL